MSYPLVYIVILNYRNYDDTSDCVKTLDKITYPNYRVAIVDNDSKNGSEEILKKEFPNHIFIQTGSNRGYSAGNNVGLQKALDDGAEYVLILNNDTLVEPDFLDKLINYAESHPDTGLLGPMIVDESGELDKSCARRRPMLFDYFWRRGFGRKLYPGNKWIKRHYYIDEYDFQDVKIVDVISGSCMLIRSELLQEIGLLDENTFLFLEEFVLYEKIRKTRYHTVILPSSRIIHKKHASVSKIRYWAKWASFQSLRYYLLRYREFGKIKTAFALVSVGIYSLAEILGSLIKHYVLLLNRRRNRDCRTSAFLI